VCTFDTAPLRENLITEALRYGTRCQGISQLYLHIRAFISKRHTVLSPPIDGLHNTINHATLILPLFSHTRSLFVILNLTLSKFPTYVLTSVTELNTVVCKKWTTDAELGFFRVRIAVGLGRNVVVPV